MIYQMPDTALNPKQKIGKIIGRPLQFYFGMDEKQKEARVIELLEKTGLSPKYYDRHPPELSLEEEKAAGLYRQGHWPRSRISSSATRSPPPLIS